MTNEFEIHRGVPHPWDSSQGWDRMNAQATGFDRLDIIIASAERKFWRLFYRDHRLPEAILVKPCGATAEWSVDPMRRGKDLDHCLSLVIGEEVFTDFTGKITKHVVTERVDGKMSNTGVHLRVAPFVRGSGAAAVDPGASPGHGKNAWIDSGWFRRAS